MAVATEFELGQFLTIRTETGANSDAQLANQVRMIKIYTDNLQALRCLKDNSFYILCSESDHRVWIIRDTGITGNNPTFATIDVIRRGWEIKLIEDLHKLYGNREKYGLK